MVSHLDGGVVAALLVGLHAFEPLNNRLNVASHFALERRGASVVHRRVDRMGARQNRFGVCPLCVDRENNVKIHRESFDMAAGSVDRRGLICPNRYSPRA